MELLVALARAARLKNFKDAVDVAVLAALATLLRHARLAVRRGVGADALRKKVSLGVSRRRHKGLSVNEGSALTLCRALRQPSHECMPLPFLYVLMKPVVTWVSIILDGPRPAAALLGLTLLVEPFRNQRTEPAGDSATAVELKTSKWTTGDAEIDDEPSRPKS